MYHQKFHAFVRHELDLILLRYSYILGIQLMAYKIFLHPPEVKHRSYFNPKVLWSFWHIHGYTRIFKHIPLRFATILCLWGTVCEISDRSRRISVSAVRVYGIVRAFYHINLLHSNGSTYKENMGRPWPVLSISFLRESQMTG